MAALRRWSGLLAVSILCVLLISGCAPVGNQSESPEAQQLLDERAEKPQANTDAAQQNTSGASQGEAQKPGDVVVPDVIGLYADDATSLLESSGLVANVVDVHGPIDSDAGPMGEVYRQTPKAGERVAPGTSIEIRNWWEGQ